MKCCVSRCKHYRRSNKTDVSFFRFPMCERVRRKWLAALFIDESSLQSDLRVCSLHFRDEDACIRGGRRKLRINAVPFLDNTGKPILSENQHVSSSEPLIYSKGDNVPVSETPFKPLISTPSSGESPIIPLIEDIVKHTSDNVLRSIPSTSKDVEVIAPESYLWNLPQAEKTTITEPVSPTSASQSAPASGPEMSDTLEIESNYDEAEDITFEDYKAVIEQIKCMACSYESTMDDLRFHILSMHLRDQFCDICEKGFSGAANDHCFKHLLIKAITQQKVQCSKCSKVFTTLRKEPKEDDTLIYCEKCVQNRGGITISKDDRQKPVNRIQCEVCLKTYAHRKTLAEHIEAIHSGNGLFQCDLCPRVFTYRKNLRAHRRIHTDPVVCEICNYTFSNRHNLSRHMTVHQQANESAEVSPVKVENA